MLYLFTTYSENSFQILTSQKNITYGEKMYAFAVIFF